MDLPVTHPVTEGAVAPVLPAATRPGEAALVVRNIDRSLPFYIDALGMQLHAREGSVARLGAGGEDVIELHERADARPPGRHAGLFHVALLYPSRLELACVAQRLAVARTRVSGASDHHTHEAIYLDDPDGNGLELAADRPRDQWPDWHANPFSGRPDPLDVPGLLALVADAEPVPCAGAGLAVGHVHLHVGDIARGIAFYRDLIGLELQMNIGSAAFVSAGGYHHHLAFNEWKGHGVGAVPPGTLGLAHWTLLVPAASDVEAVRSRLGRAGVVVADTASGGFIAHDPWGIPLRIATAHDVRRR